MEETKYVEYAKDALPAYIEEQLNMGTLKGFLPVSFIQTDRGCVGVYQMEKYVRAKSMPDTTIDILLHVIDRLLHLMEKMERNYVFPEDYLLTEETVYVDFENKEVRLIYMENQDKLSGKTQLCYLLAQWEDIASAEGAGYLRGLRSYLEEHQVGYRSAIHHVETLRHEVDVCGVL